MDAEFENEMKEKIISKSLIQRVEEICEELIDHAERADSGINRFLLKTYLLRAARYGYYKGLEVNSKI